MEQNSTSDSGADISHKVTLYPNKLQADDYEAESYKISESIEEKMNKTADNRIFSRSATANYGLSVAKRTFKASSRLTKKAAVRFNPLDKPVNKNDTTDTGIESLKLGYRATKKTYQTGKKTVRGVRVLYKAPAKTARIAVGTVKIAGSLAVHTAAVVLSPVFWILKKNETFDNIVNLTNFWSDVSKQDDERFSNRILKRLFVLNYAPNGMWTYFVSVYYMANKDENGLLDDDEFYCFLNRITAFIWTYAIVDPGVNALRTPVYAEMIKIVNGQQVDFADFRFEKANTRNKFDNYSFGNSRAITKSMLVWWAFNDVNQELIDINSIYEIEHIYAKKRHENEPLKDVKNLESLGNKAILEKRINIRAADYKFSDKIKYYIGFINSKGQKKESSKIYELTELASKPDYDFTEAEIVARYKLIMDSFMNYLKANNLLQ